MGTLSRRDFLKGTLAGTAALAGSALLGTGTFAENLIEDGETEGMSEALTEAGSEALTDGAGAMANASAAGTPKAAPAWLGSKPVLSESDVQETLETELVVVGCGTAGMFAICKAAEDGLKVIGIDAAKEGADYPKRFGAIGSRYQKEWGTQIDQFDILAAAAATAGGQVKASLLNQWADNSGEVLAWLGDLLAKRGVELVHEPEDEKMNLRVPYFATGHSVKFEDSDDGKGNELTMQQVLKDYAQKKEATLMKETTLVCLVQEESEEASADGTVDASGNAATGTVNGTDGAGDAAQKAPGKVTGVIVQDKHGKYMQINASKGVLLCTGGYAGNAQMLADRHAAEMASGQFAEASGDTVAGDKDSSGKDVSGNGASGNGASGSGIRAALWAGAVLESSHCSLLKAEDESLLASQPFLKVNARGERFINESAEEGSVLLADQFNPQKKHFVIFDDNWTQQVEQFPLHGRRRLHPFVNGAEPDLTVKQLKKLLPKLIKSGGVIQADSLEELAGKLEIDAAALKETVDLYNADAKKGKDTEFGKEKSCFVPVEKAPFYGMAPKATIAATLDGLVVDKKLRAVDKNGTPIENLYVAGNDAGGFFGQSYPYQADGMAAGKAAVQGYLVAANFSDK